MKRNILSALLIMLGIAYSNAQPGFESFSMNNQLVKDLSGYNWKMKMMRPGEGEKQGIHKIFPEDIETLVWNPAKVPGDVYTDLWKAGAIDDPYFGRNSVKAQWVQHYEWWYAAQFYKWNIPIFGNKNQFASAASVSPEQIGRIIKLERDFGYTLKRNLRLPAGAFGENCGAT